MKYFGVEFIKKEINSVLKTFGMKENDKGGGIVHFGFVLLLLLFVAFVIISLGAEVFTKNPLLPSAVVDTDSVVSVEVTGASAIGAGGDINSPTVVDTDSVISVEVTGASAIGVGGDINALVTTNIKTIEKTQLPLLLLADSSESEYVNGQYHTSFDFVVKYTSQSKEPLSLPEPILTSGLDCSFVRTLKQNELTVGNFVSYSKFYTIDCVSDESVPNEGRAQLFKITY